MRHSLAGLGLALVVLILLPWRAAAGTVLDTPRVLYPVAPVALQTWRTQYLNDPPPRIRRPPPRIRRLPQALRLRPRASRLRRLPPRPEASSRRERKSAVAVRPSEALRLAQRRWPNSIGLSVRLLGGEAPMYVVKLRTRSRVVRVLVDARSGRVMQ